MWSDQRLAAFKLVAEPRLELLLKCREPERAVMAMRVDRGDVREFQWLLVTRDLGVDRRRLLVELLRRSLALRQQIGPGRRQLFVPIVELAPGFIRTGPAAFAPGAQQRVALQDG